METQEHPQVTAKHKARQRSAANGIPRELLKDMVRAARELKAKHGALFVANPKLKDRAARLLRSILPPKMRRRGRPALDSVSVATGLLRKFRRLYPHDKPEQVWARIYPLAIAGYEALKLDEKKAQRLLLRERVRGRKNQRRRREA